VPALQLARAEHLLGQKSRLNLPPDTRHATLAGAQ